jgi:hypothetical protein
MHTATVTSLVRGTNNSQIYVIHAYHAQALSSSWLVSPYIGRANYKLKYHSAQQKLNTSHSANAAEPYYLCVEN